MHNQLLKIAKVGRSEHVVRNYLTLGDKYGVKSKTTGNQKLSPRAVFSIIHQATQKKYVIQSNKS